MFLKYRMQTLLKCLNAFRNGNLFTELDNYDSEKCTLIQR